MSLKTIDDKGRLTLGKEYAGRAVEISEESGAVHLRFVEVVPANEAWLWNNADALNAVRAGITSAARGDLVADDGEFADALAFADQLPDSDG
jgi:hypothetical protein